MKKTEDHVEKSMEAYRSIMQDSVRYMYIDLHQVVLSAIRISVFFGNSTDALRHIDTV